MSNLDPQELQQKLLLEKAINKRLDELVRQATKTVLSLLQTDNDMKSSQLRNVINVAIKPGSFEVVTNFIRYKIAVQSKSWAKGDFGHKVIADLKGKVKEIAQDVCQERGVEIDSSSDSTAIFRNDVYIQLMQLYLGYLDRAFSFYEKSESKDKQKALEYLREVVNV